MAKTRSPIKDNPLRVPGQSVDSALNEFVDNHFVLPLFLVLSMFLASIWEWFAYARHIPRQPWVLTNVSIVSLSLVFAYWRFRWSGAQALRLGREGERAVGQFLDMYTEADATVFHDVPTERGNIDHVVICSRGAYAIETKTRSKPTNGKARVVVEADSVAVGGYVPDRDPMAQASTCADNLRDILQKSTGKTFKVRPVVVFPGWYVEDKRPKGAHVWVLEPKQLPGWIRQESVIIPETDVSLASYHLSRHIRTYKSQTK